MLNKEKTMKKLITLIIICCLSVPCLAIDIIFTPTDSIIVLPIGGGKSIVLTSPTSDEEAAGGD